MQVILVVKLRETSNKIRQEKAVLLFIKLLRNLRLSRMVATDPSVHCDLRISFTENARDVT